MKFCIKSNDFVVLNTIYGRYCLHFLLVNLCSFKTIFQDEICLQVRKQYYVNSTLPVLIELKLLSENIKFEENFEVKKIGLSKLKLKPILCGKCVST